jgi:hypothetical protein
MVPAKNGAPPKGNRGGLNAQRIAPIPMEWRGPPAWRLPSGKALAEFALQSGFLAPLLIGDGPFWRLPKRLKDRSRRGVGQEALRNSGNGANQ